MKTRIYAAPTVKGLNIIIVFCEQKYGNQASWLTWIQVYYVNIYYVSKSEYETLLFIYLKYLILSF